MRKKLWFGGAVLTLLFSCGSAAAFDPEGRWDDSPFRDWYSKQRNANGQYCCDWSDAMPVSDWQANGSSYSAVVNGKWIPIPESAVLRGPNPTGHAVVWKVGSSVICFSPGTMG